MLCASKYCVANLVSKIVSLLSKSRGLIAFEPACARDGISRPIVSVWVLLILESKVPILLRHVCASTIRFRLNSFALS